MRPAARGPLALALVALCAASGCEREPDVGVTREVGYRTGTIEDEYLSNGERGNVQINELMWAGSIRGDGPERTWDADDVFVELQNKHSRPIYLTRWQLVVEVGPATDGLREPSRDDRARVTYVIPEREGRAPVQPNEFVVIAARRDGAFEADFYIEDLKLPRANFELTLMDLDNRLIDGAGDSRKPAFAGAFDRVTARSMERVQLIFNNRGNRDGSWHTYSLNDFDTGERGALHEALRHRVRPEWRPFTFATPGMPNSPDYSGYISSGSFE